jgi:hypothetical protein
MPRSDIGNHPGKAEDTACRAFTRFQNEGLLSAKRRQVQFKDLHQHN